MLSEALGSPQTVETQFSTLEVEVWRSAAGAPRRGVILLHPWAKLGGNMQDPTVMWCFRAAMSSGLFSTVVRYNMRGAGASVSKRQKLGLGLLTAPEPDPQDLVELCQHVLTQLPDPPTQLVFVGYSYGSTVAASALGQVPQAVGYVGIGFPLGTMANLVLRSRAHWAELEQSPIPKLVIAGTRDSYCPLSTLRSLVVQFNEQLEEEAAEAGGAGARVHAASLELQTIDGADHFLAGHWEDVASRVMAWIQRQADVAPSGTATA